MEDDLIFGNLAFYSAKANINEAKEFKRVALSKHLPDEYCFEGIQCVIKINKIKRQFRIMSRKYYTHEECMLGYPSKMDVDIDTMMAFKIAKLAGFEVFLEPKYSN